MKTTIYWNTRDFELIDRIRMSLKISAGININGETLVDMNVEQMKELKEYEKLGYITLRNKQ